jgi:Zn-dependent M16 (insulinase) family peptidase
MEKSTGCPPPKLGGGEIFHGFRINRVEEIPEIRVTACEAEHLKTGARVLHLHCDDKENLFSVGFRTPSRDSTGVAHILEHTVLAGSEKYPVKDAFNELSRGSLQTFINAFTYPDKTVYPVASQVRADFFNLARVYTDLVLKPRILKETFLQEGHHLTFEDPGETKSPLTVSGIVYNEMKGAYSSPDSLMYKALQEGLYPDTAYAFDSGGDPDIIPSLTYEQLRDFHKLYYSPANGRFFLYGDIPTVDHLVFLEEMLAGFDRVRVESSVGSQKRWATPRRSRRFFSIGKDEKPEGKAALNMGWLMMENTDEEEALLLQVVAHALIGTAAGPLRKALIDSGLGEDLSPVSGLEHDLKQVAFAVGLRGTDPDKADRFEALVLETLQKLVGTGFDRDLIEAALHQVEFHGKEIVRGNLPYSIFLMSRIYHTWLYEGDPLSGLRFNRTIEGIRRRWEGEPDLFQRFLRRWLLENPHRFLSIMEPSPTFQENQLQAFRERMAARKAGLSKETLEKIRQEAEVLQRIQMEPDSPAALATLPRLKMSDIPGDIDRIPVEKAEVSGIPVLRHEIFTNGIAYLDLAFDLSGVPPDLQPYLPLSGRLTTGMGAAGFTYEEMAKRIALKTGGVGYSLAAGLTADGRKTWQKIVFRVRALHRNVPEALEILFDLLSQGDLSDASRMRDLLFEMRNRMHAAVIPSGHIFAQRSAAAAQTLPAYLDELWHGRSQLQVLATAADSFADGQGDLVGKVETLRELLFRQGGMTVNITADAGGLQIVEENLAPMLRRLRGGSLVVTSAPVTPSPVSAGVAIPAQVCYVAKVLRAPAYSDPMSPALYVLSRELSKGYLYKRIRVQGGAYGGISQYDPTNGFFSFLSYRDPRLVETLRVYEEAIESRSRQKIDEEDLERAIIGSIGSLDRPMDPAGKGFVSMIRDFAGITDEDRLRFRKGVFAVTGDSLLEAVRHCLLPALETASIAVYASDDRLRKANEFLRPELSIEPLLESSGQSTA